MNGTKVNGLLISAGLSGRMGEFKPLMQFNGEPFVTGITRKLVSFCEKVVIVTGFQNEKVEALIDSQFSITRLDSTRLIESERVNSQFPNKVTCVYNPNYTKGMFTSLKAGIEQLKNSEWVLYHFVDQPFFTNEFYKKMVSQANDEFDWVQPVHDGKEGHPVMFNKKVIDMIAESPLDSNLRMIRDLPVIRKNYWNCDCPEVLVDFDTKEDLKRFDSNQ